MQVIDRVMTSHNTCSSWTSRVLIVASLQRLKMVALIPTPANCEVRSVMKIFKNKQSGMLNVGVVLLNDKFGHTRLDGQHISCRRSTGKCLIIHPIARTSHPVISIFFKCKEISVPAASAFSEWQRGGDECHTVVPIPGGWLLRHRNTKVGPTLW